MGYPTLTQYWKTRYPQWTAARTAFEQTKWVNRAAPDYIVGICMYGKDTSFENGNYHIEDSEYQRLLAEYSAQVRSGSTPPVDDDPDAPIPDDNSITPESWQRLQARVKALEAWKDAREGEI